MSERKVLNKYYPPDFDPSKIPRMKLPRNRQYTVRLMAPFNMRCVTCGEYIYKGKKFNARKEDVEGEDYLGIRIYRFYIKCTRCLQEISFKTDPRNTDYEIEAGATRNFMALKLAEEQAQREEDERREDEATNPMKLLENRTKQSKQELELLESLEELRDLNRRQRSVDYDTMLAQFDDRDLQRQLAERQEEEDEKLIRSVFKSSSSKMKVIEEQIVDADGPEEPPLKKQAVSQELEPSDPVPSLTQFVPANSSLTCITKPNSTFSSATPVKSNSASWNLSVGAMPAKKGALSSLVRVKKPVANGSDTQEKPTEMNSVISSTSVKSSSGPSGLSLLGSYSDTDSDET